MDDCLFCKIAAGQIPSNKLYEDDTLLAFYDIDPQAPVHFLVIPKQHIESAAKLTEADAALLGHIYATIADLCKQLGVDESGYRVVTNVGADGGHQFVVFVGNGDLRSLVADRVDAVVDRRTLGLVGGLAVNFEEVFDLIEHRFLGCEVRCAELLRPLEHQVFEIVRQSGGLGRVVLAAHVHGDVGLDARRLLVDAHIDFQPVVQGVDFGVQRIALHCFVLVLRIRTSRGQHRCDDYRKE